MIHDKIYHFHVVVFLFIILNRSVSCKITPLSGTRLISSYYNFAHSLLFRLSGPTDSKKKTFISSLPFIPKGPFPSLNFKNLSYSSLPTRLFNCSLCLNFLLSHSVNREVRLSSRSRFRPHTNHITLFSLPVTPTSLHLHPFCRPHSSSSMHYPFFWCTSSYHSMTFLKSKMRLTLPLVTSLTRLPVVLDFTKLS